MNDKNVRAISLPDQSGENLKNASRTTRTCLKILAGFTINRRSNDDV
jgi:hypothetical protein